MSIEYFLDGEEVPLKGFLDGIEKMYVGEIEAGEFCLDIEVGGGVVDATVRFNSSDGIWFGTWDLDEIGINRAVFAAIGALKQFVALRELKAAVPTEEEVAILLFEEQS